MSVNDYRKQAHETAEPDLSTNLGKLIASSPTFAAKAQESAPSSEDIATWQDRAQEIGFAGRYPDVDEVERLKHAEIADLRAALARRATAGNAAPTDEPQTMEQARWLIAYLRRRVDVLADAVQEGRLATPAATAAPGDLHARLAEMSEILRADGKWDGNEFVYADKSESDIAMLDDLLTEVLRLASNAGAAPAWIDTDERLPEDGQDVIILYWPYDNRENERVAGSAHHVEGTFYDEDGNDMHPPSHWMPLNIPAAPSSPVDAKEGDK